MIKKHGIKRQAEWLKLTAVTVVALSLAACGGSKSADASQVLAKVDGNEITIHQLNNEMRDLSSDRAADKKGLLDSLVDRTLLVEAAQAAKLDQTPGVLQELERAKAQILARAYLQSRVQNSVPPSAAEVSAFYRNNPDLFAQRKTYTFDELIIDRKVFPADAETQLKDVNTLEQAAAYFDAKGISYRRVSITRSAADLTPNVLKALKQNEADTSHLVAVIEKNAVAMLRITRTQLTPVSETDAAPKIQRYLANKSSAEKVQNEVKQLRTKAKISYMNEQLIDGPSAPEVPAAVSSSTASAPAGQTAVSPSVSPDSSSAASPNSAVHINRGAAGLR